jgi:hypothetical protein
MTSSRTLFAVALAAAVAVSHAYGGADEILKALKDKPEDRAQLQKLKGALSGIADQDEKCRCGVIYCLGMLALGDAAEGLTVRSQIARAYPKNPLLAELSDQSVCEACKSCTGGKAETGCKKCLASGTCSVCGGGGLSKGKGLKGEDLPCAACKGVGKCTDCSGSGKVTQSCKACGAKGLAPSKEKCMEAYLRLLK